MSAARLVLPERNTKCYLVILPHGSLMFSYETCIGFDLRGKKGRLANDWGPTTGRHMNDLGIKHFPVIDRDIFDATLEALLQ